MTTDSTLHVRPPVGLLLLAVAVGGAFYLIGKSIETRAARTPTQPGMISVTGEGRVTTPPDIALLSFGVRTKRARSATEAIAELKRTMADVIAAVKKQGVPEKDIRTESFYLSPVYDYEKGRQIPRGFEASQMLSVKVRDLDKTGDVLNAATSGGANESHGVVFTIDEPEGQRAAARQEAIDQAKQKARTLADQLGVSLGRLTQFSEGGGYGYPETRMMLAQDAGGAKAMANEGIDLPAGEQDTYVEVTLTYELR